MAGKNERRNCAGERTFRFNCRAVVGAVATVCCLLLTACGTAETVREQNATVTTASTKASRGQSLGPSFTGPGVEPSGWSVSYPITLPAGYQMPTGLTADATGDLWFVSTGDTNQTVFHWAAGTGNLATFNVPSGVPGGMFTPIVVDSAGRAWVGENRTLLEVDPTSGSIRAVSLPPVTVGAPDSGLGIPGPTDPGEQAAITALSVGAGGSIVVARQFATELQMVNPSTFTVSTLALPSNTALVGDGVGTADLVSSENGADIVVAMHTAHGLGSISTAELGQYVAGGWHVTTAPCPPAELHVSAGQLTVSGPDCLATGTIPSAGPITVSNLPVAGMAVSTCGLSVSSTAALACDKSGLEAVTSGKVTPGISLGRTYTGNAYTGAPAEEVPVTNPLLLAWGGTGKAWFVASLAGTARIGLVEMT